MGRLFGSVPPILRDSAAALPQDEGEGGGEDKVIRMWRQDNFDLYDRVSIGTKVVVLG